MSGAPTYRPKRLNKPPACDSCKQRRVLCHPQPNGAPCPRCAERNIVCVTTPTSRGRPRKNPMHYSTLELPKTTGPLLQTSPTALGGSSISSLTLISPQVAQGLSDCPELTPGLVSHLFDCFDHCPQVLHPLVRATAVKSSIRTVSYQLHLLPTQLRVLALTIIAYASPISFHEAILGSGPRPRAFDDAEFFTTASRETIHACGARRQPVCRALHATALRAAWDTGVMLQVSNENAATCFFLDLLEQSDFGGLSRPWASAYLSHVRALAPMWRTSGAVQKDETTWAGFLMGESMLSTRSRKPSLVSLEDQILLSGPQPMTLEELLASIEEAAHKPGVKPFYAAMKPYFYHVTCLSRKCWQTVTGDHARLAPLSETATIQALNALTTQHAIITHLLARADTFLSSFPRPITPFVIHEPTDERAIRGASYILAMTFAHLVLALFRALDGRDPTKSPTTESSSSSPSSSGVSPAPPAQARQLVRTAVHDLARTIDNLPTIHYVPTQLHTLRNFALFAMEDLQADLAQAASNRIVLDEAAPDRNLLARFADLTKLVSQMGMTAYSVDLTAAPTVAAVFERLDKFVQEFASRGPGMMGQVEGLKHAHAGAQSPINPPPAPLPQRSTLSHQTLYDADVGLDMMSLPLGLDFLDMSVGFDVLGGGHVPQGSWLGVDGHVAASGGY
ncbi:Zn(2)-C6 fungal-type domain-containing protein [Mycena kentingensis (nom. inval.)]|nr:Zn(2)-C6 fungal-type domain-containing protein [Mycena kentingensis (nom. inval.)]